jgi:hypothetical protein
MSGNLRLAKEPPILKGAGKREQMLRPLRQKSLWRTVDRVGAVGFTGGEGGKNSYPYLQPVFIGVLRPPIFKGLSSRCITCNREFAAYTRSSLEPSPQLRCGGC